MNERNIGGRMLRSALLMGVAVGAVMTAPVPVLAQAQPQPVEEIIVTGSRIARPTLTSSSPVYSVTSADIAQQQQPEIEKIFRILPVTIPGDGDAVNNGTEGAATLDMRGLGPQRNLILVDGKRLTPFSQLGQVDVSQIPTALIERVDILTGGGSAVYGSDAISGAVNFILKKDFEGVDANYNYSQTGEEDGRVNSADVTLGTGIADKGNAVLHVNFAERKGVQLGQRPLGRLGIVTATGGGLADFKAGRTAAQPPAGCTGENAVSTDAGGSTTTLPTRLAIFGTSGGLGQFRSDGTLGPNCSVFNFNPYNYYQTPMERFGGTALANYEINDHVEVYGRLNYTSTNVRQQVAPSGIFASDYFVPLANPFLTAQARAEIIAGAESRRRNGELNANNWRDLNNNGVVDQADDLRLVVRRRTVELGERFTEVDANTFQFIVGARGDIVNDWSYDLSFQHGEVKRSVAYGGYTNLTNIGNALNAVSTTACRGGQPGCVPLNIFGGEGTITRAMADYITGTAIRQQSYKQTIASGSVTGPLAGVRSPLANEPVSVALGAEYREESATDNPDLCLRLPTTSCLGGFGGYFVPLDGAFDVSEVFGEVVVPVVADRPFFKALDVEAAYRYSDYSSVGGDSTWKGALNWAFNDTVRLRYSYQRAARAPNLSEIAAGRVSGLNNANVDPCSSANPAARTDATLRARCVATGMTLAQVGNVENLAAGQINVFNGTDLVRPPTTELADTQTLGVVLTPDFLDPLRNPVLTVDYYHIDIQNFIGTFAPQEVLNACYFAGIQSECNKITRVGGTLTNNGSGVELLTTNLSYFKVAGIEVGANFGIDLEALGGGSDWGSLSFSWNGNWYLQNELQSASFNPVLDCLGRYGPNCQGGGGSGSGNPTPEFRFVQRTNYTVGDFTFGYLWRFIGSSEIEEGLKEPSLLTGAGTFNAFETIPAYHYFDVNAEWRVIEGVTVRASVTNIFDRDPPIVGNEAGQTSANSGNTFPSMYDTLGQVYAIGVNFRF